MGTKENIDTSQNQNFAYEYTNLLGTSWKLN